MRVLIVEDLQSDAELIEHELLRAFPDAEFRRVETYDDYLDGLESFCPDLILSDYQLPSFNGLLALQLALERRPETPFLLVTGSLNEETAVQCMKAGAWDYILKERIRTLAPAVLGAVEKQRLRAAHRRAALELRESEERYRSLFERTHAVMLLIDPESGRIVDANPAAATYYGWPREILCRKRIQEINTLDEDAILAKLALAREGDTSHLHFCHRLADGTVREVEVFSGPIRLGQRVLLFSIINDVTERIKAQRAWHLAQLCIDNAAIGIFHVDEEGYICEANACACASLGYSRQELCTLTITDINPHLSLPQWREHRRTVRSKGSGTIETYHRRRDGIVFPVEVTVNYFEYEGKMTSFSFVRDISERRAYEKQLEHQTTHDDLTGLANRALLYDRLEQSIHFADRADGLVGVLLLDLDRFKIINDSLGHSIGDELLCRVARRLTASVRHADTVARLGGDEFVILLAEVADGEDVGLVAQKIMENVSRPYRICEREIIVTPSLGISLYPQDGKDKETLLRNADTAMYRAKEEKNSFRFYAAEMNARIMETLELEGDLRAALKKNELLLHYQPKVDLATGRVIGAEALLRWKHEKRGSISPGAFIPLAEETGLILPISEWVLQTVCRQILAWQKDGLPGVPVAVNLSARQFRREGLVESIDRILAETRIDPGLLELELTESMIMRDPQIAAGILRTIKALGVRLALDDFGTGYSSLNYLRRFPVDFLKIDRSFIGDVATDRSAAAVVASIVAIAHSLDLHAVAEGVETREQLDFLRNCGCDSFQGFYFSRPLPAEEFAALQRRGEKLESVRMGKTVQSSS